MKQLKYTKLRAYSIIQDLESKGLSNEEIVSSISLLIEADSSEFQRDVLSYALKTVTLRQELPDAVQVMDSSFNFIDGRIQRKVTAKSCIKTTGRKTRGNNKN